MDLTRAIGFLLVGLSAAMLAEHWRRWRDSRANTSNTDFQETFGGRQLRRRTLASSLLGLLGASLTAYEAVPRTPLSITVYLFGLIALTCGIFSLGVLDMVATRHFREREEIDRIAKEFRHAKLQPTPHKSVKT